MFVTFTIYLGELDSEVSVNPASFVGLCSKVVSVEVYSVRLYGHLGYYQVDRYQRFVCVEKILDY